MVSCPACHHSRGSGERLAKIAVMFFWATVKAARRWGCKVGGLGQGVWSPCLESLSIRSLGLLSMCFPQDDDLVNFSPFDFVTQPKKFEIHFICSKKKKKKFREKEGQVNNKGPRFRPANDDPASTSPKMSYASIKAIGSRPNRWENRAHNMTGCGSQ